MVDEQELELAAARLLQRELEPEPPAEATPGSAAVEIYLDTSGSMPDPTIALNAMTLAAQVLAASAIRQRDVAGLAAADLPGLPLYVHVDLDVLDPGEAPGLRFPTPGGPAAGQLAGAWKGGPLFVGTTVAWMLGAAIVHALYVRVLAPRMAGARA